MQEVSVTVPDEMYAYLEGAAGRHKHSVSAEIVDIIKAGMPEQAASVPTGMDGPVSQESAEEEADRQIDRDMLLQYVKHRLKGEEAEQIAPVLGCTGEDLAAFDRYIQASRQNWNRTYFDIREKFDPLTWEMKYMDTFAEFWGPEP